MTDLTHDHDRRNEQDNNRNASNVLIKIDNDRKRTSIDKISSIPVAIMSLVQSISIDSSSSIDTMSTIPSTDITQNLYENRDHFQAIFTNDSRFFDTSLHLFKSYASMGYISSNGIKTKTQLLSPLTGGHRHRWRTRLLGPRHHEHHPIDTLKALLTPTLLRKQGK